MNDLRSHFKVFLGMFAVWFSAWGIWSRKIPYYVDDLPFSWKLLHESSVFSAVKKTFSSIGWLPGTGGFERPMYAVYGWFGYRLGAPALHILIAFFHLMTAYLFWIVLNRMKYSYLKSTCIAFLFLVFPISFEGFSLPAAWIQPNLLIFLVACLLFLDLRVAECFFKKLIYLAALNILMFFMYSAHPALYPSIFLIAIFEMILSLKENLGWKNAMTRMIKTGVFLSIGPVIYMTLYITFPHIRTPGDLDALRVFHVFLSVQYHCLRALLSMLSLEWISNSFRAITSSFWAFLVFIACSVVFYSLCFYNMFNGKAGEAPVKSIGIDLLWGYLWFILSFCLHFLDGGFASTSRHYYVPSLGLSIMAGSIIFLLAAKLPTRRMASIAVFFCIVLGMFFACGAVYDHDGTPRFWKAAINREASAEITTDGKE